MYVPNGQVVGSDKYAYKLEWFQRLRAYLERHHRTSEPLILCGDFNVAPEPRDVDRPQEWERSVLFHPDVRAALRERDGLGAHRHLPPPPPGGRLLLLVGLPHALVPQERRPAARPHPRHRSRWPAAAPRRPSTATSARASSPPTTCPSWRPSRRTERRLPSPDADADLVVVGAGAAGPHGRDLGRADARPRPARRRRSTARGCSGRRSSSPAAGAATSPTTRWTRRAFNGSTPAAIRKVLRRFDVARDDRLLPRARRRAQARGDGQALPRHRPRAHRARRAARRRRAQAGVELRHPWRVTAVARERRRLRAHVAAGGRRCARRASCSPPAGAACPRRAPTAAAMRSRESLGHTLTARIFPALVPLVVPARPLRARAQRPQRPRGAGGARGVGPQAARAVTGSLLCTHFGLSGPAALDISRHFLDARMDEPGARLSCAGCPSRRPRAWMRRCAAWAARPWAASSASACPSGWPGRCAPQPASIPRLPGTALARGTPALAAAAAEMTVPVDRRSRLRVRRGDGRRRAAERAAPRHPALAALSRPLALRRDLRRGRPHRRLQLPVGLGQRLCRGNVGTSSGDADACP